MERTPNNTPLHPKHPHRSPATRNILSTPVHQTQIDPGQISPTALPTTTNRAHMALHTCTHRNTSLSINSTINKHTLVKTDQTMATTPHHVSRPMGTPRSHHSPITPFPKWVDLDLGLCRMHMATRRSINPT